MAMFKYAYARTTQPIIRGGAWDKVRVAASKERLDRNLIEQAEKILKGSFDPSNYVLTHATIVASVDTDEVPNTRLGKTVENGRNFNRKTASYRIRDASEKYINQNHDSWSRDVLLASYQTFIGGHNFCFAPGTPVLMSDGTTKPIEQISVGDMVFSHTGDVRRVTHVFDREFTGEICSVKFDRYKTPLLVTGNHPFLAVGTEFEPVSQRRNSKSSSLPRYVADQKVRALRGLPHSLRGFKASQEWVTADKLQRGSFALGMPVREDAESTADTDRAVILGYYLAEGCQLTKVVEIGNSKGVVITPGIHERAVVDDILERVPRCFPGTKITVSKSHSNTWMIELRGRDIGNWLLSNGGQYSENKRISESVMAWGGTQLRAIFGAWLNGDGSIGTKGRLRGSTVSPHLARQMLTICDLVGIRASCTKTVVDKTVIRNIQMVVGGVAREYPVIPKHDVWTITVSRGDVPAVGRTTIIWADSASKVGKKLCDFSQWNNRRVHKVSSIERLPYHGHVYNFEVEEDHSYVVGHGVCVHNCEHVQQEELSKGRIIDAVARDIGESVYVDILIATDRKHAALIRDIESGRMSTLSMGCTIDGSTCTKCGNWAADETEMCDDIRYSKGNVFYDENGGKHRVAELCGDVSLSPTAGVNFIEASWVEVPAFKGAVARNILTLNSDDTSKTAQRLESIVSTLPPVVDRTTGMARAASRVAEGDPNPFADIEDSIKTQVLERVRKDLEKGLTPPPGGNDTVPSDGPNDSILHQARRIYAGAIRTVMATAPNRVAFARTVARLNRESGILLREFVYSTPLKVGSLGFTDAQTYLAACARLNPGTKITHSEQRALIRMGKLVRAFDRRQLKANARSRRTPQ